MAQLAVASNHLPSVGSTARYRPNMSLYQHLRARAGDGNRTRITSLEGQAGRSCDLDVRAFPQVNAHLVYRSIPPATRCFPFVRARSGREISYDVSFVRARCTVARTVRVARHNGTLRRPSRLAGAAAIRVASCVDRCAPCEQSSAKECHVRDRGQCATSMSFRCASRTTRRRGVRRRRPSLGATATTRRRRCRERHRPRWRPDATSRSRWRRRPARLRRPDRAWTCPPCAAAGRSR